MSDDLRQLMRPDLADLAMYHPVGLPQDLAHQLGVPVEQIIKLDANENPFGAPPGVAEALAAFPAFHRYPDPAARELRAALATYTGAGIERIVVGNGSDELLDLICRLFISPGDRVITCEPTFGMYAVAARLNRATVRDVPRRADFSVDVEGVVGAAGTARLLFLCLPNNPTGTTVPEADLRRMIEATGNGVVVIDEAYAEYATTNCLPLTGEYPHLIVLRTLSKFCGLAGLRVGYGVCPPAVAEKLHSIRAPYNVNGAGQVAGRVALANRAWLAETVALVKAERTRLGQALAAVPGLTPLPSDANFFLVRVDGGRAQALYEGLMARGIMIRYFTRPDLRDYVRISVGTPEQNTALLAALHAVMRER
jgi:histidinol-phosphate aminotransferase